MDAIKNRYDIVMLFDVKNGNPNGDPDGDNRPRQHHFGDEHGIVTDVCLKRKVRDFVIGAVEAGVIPADGHDIYIQSGKPLNAKDAAAVKAATGLDVKEAALKTEVKKLAGSDKDKAIHDALCEMYFDARTFGAVFASLANTSASAAVRGPVQVSMAESIDDICPERITVTRLCVTKDEDASKGSTFGNKWIVPYGLYRCNIHISAAEAKKTGFSDDDLDLLIKALTWLFDNDHSAARGEMTVRKLIVCKHNSMWGDAPFAAIENVLDVQKVEGCEEPSCYGDYAVTVNKDAVPATVEVTEVV